MSRISCYSPLSDDGRFACGNDDALVDALVPCLEGVDKREVNNWHSWVDGLDKYTT
jgi:hypothetical protein